MIIAPFLSRAFLNSFMIIYVICVWKSSSKNRIALFSLYFLCLFYALNPSRLMTFFLQNSSKAHLLLNPYRGNPSLCLITDCAWLSMIYLPPYCLKNSEMFSALYCGLLLQTYQCYHLLRYFLPNLLFLWFLLNLMGQMLIFEFDTIAYSLQVLTLSIMHLFSGIIDRIALFDRVCSLLMLFTSPLFLDPQPLTLRSLFLFHKLVFHIVWPIIY